MNRRRSQTLTIRNLIILALGFLSATWCFAEDNKRKQAADAVDISSHALRSAKLRQTMHDLEKLMLEQMYTQLELDQRSQQYTKVFSERVLELERTASYIQEALKEVDLNPVQQREFLRLADQLRTQALQLYQQIPHASATELRHGLDRMEETCNNCHSQFRLSLLPE